MSIILLLTVGKVSNIIFCENLVELNEARLHEATFTRMREFFHCGWSLVFVKKNLIQVREMC